MRRPTLTLLSSLIAAAIASAAACNGGTPAAPSMGAAVGVGDAAPSFSAVPAYVYVAKVKNILVGLPPTDAEIAAVTADPTQLKTLIDQWMLLPEYTAKMQVFFELAFQQTQVLGHRLRGSDLPEANGHQRYDDAAHRPERDRELLAHDAAAHLAGGAAQSGDDHAELHDDACADGALRVPRRLAGGRRGERDRRLQGRQPQRDDHRRGRGRADPDRARRSTRRARTTCTGTTRTSPTTPRRAPAAAATQSSSPRAASTLHFSSKGRSTGGRTRPGGTCFPQGGTAAGASAHGERLHDLEDGHDPPAEPRREHHRVLRPADAPHGERARAERPARRLLHDAGVLRQLADEHEQHDARDDEPGAHRGDGGVGRRHGYDGPPFDPRPRRRARRARLGLLPVPPAPRPDAVDPRGDVLVELPPARPTPRIPSSPASSPSKGSSSRSRRSTISRRSSPSTHSSRRRGCRSSAYYVNSTACDTSDPEFQRIVGVFTNSGFSWNALVRRASLVAAHHVRGADADGGDRRGGRRRLAPRSPLRRAERAPRIHRRLRPRRDDGERRPLTTIPEIVSGLPSDGYGRGSVAPVLPNQPTLFYRAGTENICEAVAALTIDVPTGKAIPGVTQWSSTQPTPAIADFVSTVMGLPSSDPRAASGAQRSSRRATRRRSRGAPQRLDALKSTFVAACMAPSAISIGL